MMAQRSSGGGEKKMSCAVAWISCPRWTKMLLDSKERGSNQHQVDISSCKSHRQQSSHDRSQTPESQTSEKFGLSLRSIFVVVIYFKRVISLCRILIHHLCQLLLRVSDGFCEDKEIVKIEGTGVATSKGKGGNPNA